MQSWIHLKYCSEYYHPYKHLDAALDQKRLAAKDVWRGNGYYRSCSIYRPDDYGGLQSIRDPSPYTGKYLGGIEHNNVDARKLYKKGDDHWVNCLGRVFAREKIGPGVLDGLGTLGCHSNVIEFLFDILATS